MNMYSKFYYSFYLISGKKNNPELTAIMLLSTFLFMLLLLVIFYSLMILKAMEVFEFKEAIVGRKDIFKFSLLGLGTLIVLVNCIIFIPRGPEIIRTIKSDLTLHEKLRKKRPYLIAVSVVLMIAIIASAGMLYR